MAINNNGKHNNNTTGGITMYNRINGIYNLYAVTQTINNDKLTKTVCVKLKTHMINANRKADNSSNKEYNKTAYQYIDYANTVDNATSQLYSTLAIPCRNRRDVMTVCRIDEKQLGNWIKSMSCRATASALKYANMYSVNGYGEYICRIYRQISYNAHSHNYQADIDAEKRMEGQYKDAKKAEKDAKSKDITYTETMIQCVDKRIKRTTVTHKIHVKGGTIKELMHKRAREISIDKRVLKGKSVYQSIEADDIISATIISGYEWIDGKRTNRDKEYISMYRYMYNAARTAIRRASHDNGKYTAMPTITDNSDTGIENYIDYVAYNGGMFNDCLTAGELIAYLDAHVKTHYPLYMQTWEELKAHDGKAHLCTSRQSARTLLNHLKHDALTHTVQGI